MARWNFLTKLFSESTHSRA